MKRTLTIFVFVLIVTSIASCSIVALAQHTSEDYINSPRVTEDNYYRGEYYRWLQFQTTHDNGLDYGTTIVQIQQGYSGVRKMATTRNVYGMYAQEVYSSAYIKNNTGLSADFQENSTPVSEGYTYSCKAEAKLSALSYNVKETTHYSYLLIDGEHYDNYVYIYYR